MELCISPGNLVGRAFAGKLFACELHIVGRMPVMAKEQTPDLEQIGKKSYPLSRLPHKLGCFAGCMTCALREDRVSCTWFRKEKIKKD